MNIDFYEIPAWQADYIKTKLEGHSLRFFEREFNAQALPEAGADIISTFTTSKVNEATLGVVPELKLVATRTTGFDHIDLSVCATKNVTVCNVPTYGENTVAEQTFAILLTITRKLFESIKRVREQGKFTYDGLMGTDLKGKTIGVVGAGNIGRHVIAIAKGFQMNVVVFDSYGKPELADQLGFTYTKTLQELLAQSDIVTLHVPYLPSTHHMINAEALQAMKRGAILLNTARGALVDTMAMVDALKTGQLAAVGLDVLEEEGHIKDELDFLASGHPQEAELKLILADHNLMNMENVVITPHNAFQTKEALLRILDTTIANIQSFTAGTPQNTVKP